MVGATPGALFDLLRGKDGRLLLVRNKARCVRRRCRLQSYSSIAIHVRPTAHATWGRAPRAAKGGGGRLAASSKRGSGLRDNVGSALSVDFIVRTYTFLMEGSIQADGVPLVVCSWHCMGRAQWAVGERPRGRALLPVVAGSRVFLDALVVDAAPFTPNLAPPQLAVRITDGT